MNELLKFSHDRNAPFEQSSAALKDGIDAFVSQPELEGVYDHFQKSYSLPVDVVKQQISKYLERVYDYKTCGFSRDLSMGKLAKMTMRYVGYLVYVTLRSRKYDQSPKEYELIVEWVLQEQEIDRFSRLIDLFGKENVLITAAWLVNKEGYNISYRPSCKFYAREEVLRAFSRELGQGLGIYLDLSRKLKINLLPIVNHILNQYLYYTSIFKYNRAKYCIQERHYQTSAVKNFLFRKYDGSCSASIQKNIHQITNCGFYYDADVFFTLGKRTADRAFDYGARIGEVVPVGSLFMEHGWFSEEKDRKAYDKEYDIIYLGINFSNARDNLDSYTSFVRDYYETFRWLAQFAKENPHLKIGIKHRPSSGEDPTEQDIISGSPVITIGGNDRNSYETAFKSRCVVTYCSTMGYELIAHGVPVLFLDPGRRNVTWFSEKSLIDEYRVTTYDEFRSRAEDLLGGGKILTETDNICLNSENVSGRIYDYFRKEVKI